MESRNGLIVDLRVGPATGFGERDGALAMLDLRVAGREGATLGGDDRGEAREANRAERDHLEASAVWIASNPGLGVTPTNRGVGNRSPALPEDCLQGVGVRLPTPLRVR